MTPPFQSRLWAGWRSEYISGLPSPGAGSAPGEGSLFERILASGRPDNETLIVWRGNRCFALLNLYPYTTGHVLVLPNRAVADLSDLGDEEAAELWHGVRSAVRAVQAAYRCEGLNVGFNLGRAGGAGVPDHLHAHVLPRWAGDTNFMATVAETRVLPEALEVSWAKVREAWTKIDEDVGDTDAGQFRGT